MYQLIILVLLLLLIRRSLAIVTVQGRSMEPALAGGDRVLILRLWPHWFLRYGQVIVCNAPSYYAVNKLTKNNTAVKKVSSSYGTGNEAAEQPYYIKRVWGLKGAQIFIPQKNVRDLPLNNSEMIKHNTAGNLVCQVPSGYCFVKGDSVQSCDSTTWGPIPLDRIIGIVLLKLPRRAELIETKDERSAVASAELPRR
jgi:signal peptidase I